GWALPENTKFGKKGSGKKIKTKVIDYLKQFFLNELLQDRFKN
ncbi:7348_t:CDS:1, partial [Cetraspora pellucida]